MADPREEILARLLVVAAGIDGGLKKAVRNETKLSKTEYPAVILIDGMEEGDAEDPDSRPSIAPRRMTMAVELQFRLQETAEDVGTRLNQLRAKLIKTVTADATLLAMTIRGRGVRYAGSNPVVERGEMMQGAIGCGFDIRYELYPQEIA